MKLHIKSRNKSRIKLPIKSRMESQIKLPIKSRTKSRMSFFQNTFAQFIHSNLILLCFLFPVESEDILVNKIEEKVPKQIVYEVANKVAKKVAHNVKN